jgi:hypothetical protein
MKLESVERTGSDSEHGHFDPTHGIGLASYIEVIYQ